MCDCMGSYRLRIREFLRQPTAQSSILLVIGKRGSGKSRLVDESLNNRPSYSEVRHKLLAWLDGRNRDSRRLQIRQPRDVNRYLLKVDVDPFFPTVALPKVESDASKIATFLVQDQSDERLRTISDAEVAFHLLSNIVFSITSMIDARPSISAHGRTLRAILGFWRYWFAPNAVLLPNMSNFWVIGLMAVAYLVFRWWVQFASVFLNGANYMVGIEYISCAFFIAFFCGYLLLRWRDLSAVIKMGGKLYELAHAQESLRTDEVKYSTNTQWKHKWALPTGLVLATGALILKRPEVNSLNLPMSNELVPALFGASALSLVISFARTKEAKASYGSKNPMWMITLLRRYLFLLHRCGMEPVLVFDELDKLETSCRSVDYPLSDKLSLFLNGILRIRNTIGTNFKIILIGSESVGCRLYEERNPRSLGPIGTLVHQAIILGPLSLEHTKQLLYSADNFVKYERLHSYGYSVEYTWLRAYGITALMVYDLNMLSADEDKVNPICDKVRSTEVMAQLISGIWTAEGYLQYLEASACSFIKANQDWLELWLHTGMLELANALVFDIPGKDIITSDYLERLWQTELEAYFKEKHLVYIAGVYDQRLEKPAIALQAGAPAVLIALGKYILLRHLKKHNLIKENKNGVVIFKIDK